MRTSVSRRTTLRLMLQAAAGRALCGLLIGAGRGTASERHSVMQTVAVSQAARRQQIYRIDATIYLLGMPVVRRKDVGTACVTVETGLHGTERAVALQFAAGSAPARAHGYNRFGVIREVAILNHGELIRSACAGFMTSSPEQSIDAVKDSAKVPEKTPCTMVASESTRGATHSWKAKFDLPGATRWEDCGEILAQSEQNEVSSSMPATRREGPWKTFLHAVSVAAGEGAHEVPFFYNAEPHVLRSKLQDGRLEGNIYGAHGAKKSNFTLWLRDSAPLTLPERISFRARSFLQLNLEAVPGRMGSESSALPWLLRDEI